ncbi:MAG TPA: hypothetical protein VM818_02095 [Vicinamibacterales bacterium]|nr:hypothetical protein [Vicinamibacterales bacterium]
MPIRPRIFWVLFAIPLMVTASQPSAAGQLVPGDFVTFILLESGSLPEPHDPDVRLGVGGSAVEQPTDVLVYTAGSSSTFAGSEVPGICATGTVQTAELIDPEGKRPKRTISVITTHPNVVIPPETRLEELQIFAKCVDANDKVYIQYMGTLRALPGAASAGR